jgi:hypothetical protein
VANSGFVVCSRADISPKPALAGAFGLADARRGGYDGRAAEFATSVNMGVVGNKANGTQTSLPFTSGAKPRWTFHCPPRRVIYPMAQRTNSRR